MTHQEIRRAAHERFDAVATELARKVEGRFDDYVAVLAGVRARFNSTAPLSHADFRDYVAGLNLAQSYPGFQAMNYAPLVTAEQKPAFEAAMRNDSGLDRALASRFAVKPPGDRAVYYPLAFIEPLDGNESLLGNDLGAMPNRGNALEQARDSGGLASSGRRTPHRRARRRRRPGDAAAGLSTRHAARHGGAATRGLHGLGRRRLQRRADDAGAAGRQPRLVAAAAPARCRHECEPDRHACRNALRHRVRRRRASAAVRQRAPGAGPDTPAAGELQTRFERTLAFDLGGHSWLVEVGQDEFEVVGRLDGKVSWLIALGGTAISALLAAIVHSLATSRSRAQVLAAGMTRHLRRSERQLAEAQHLAKVGSWTLDPASGALHCSEEACRLLGFGAGVMADLPSLLACVPDEERAMVERSILGASCSRERSEFEHRVRWPVAPNAGCTSPCSCARRTDGRWFAAPCGTTRSGARPRCAWRSSMTWPACCSTTATPPRWSPTRCRPSAPACAGTARALESARGRPGPMHGRMAWRLGPGGGAVRRISRTLHYRPDEGSLGRAWTATSRCGSSSGRPAGFHA
jgi:PAS domain-containing protein